MPRAGIPSFYAWYFETDMEVINLNNAGDPMTDEPWKKSSKAFEHEPWKKSSKAFEREVMGRMIPEELEKVLETSRPVLIVLCHGVNVLKNKTKLGPVVYVSDEAHDSNMRLAHLQNLDMQFRLEF